jgi:TonB family protein
VIRPSRPEPLPADHTRQAVLSLRHPNSAPQSRRARNLIAVAALFATLLSGTSDAQTPGREDRKVVSRIAPFYPEIAKRMQVGGVIKLEVVGRANGRVKSTKVVGGSPVLIQAATTAVEKCKFEVAPQETTEAVQVVFELP